MLEVIHRAGRGAALALAAGLALGVATPATAPAQQSAPESGPDRVAPGAAVETNRATSAPTTRPTVRPARTDEPPAIDGRLDDAVWQTAAKLTEFYQQQPLDGAPASEQSEVYIAYDSDHIYFGFYAHYQDPSIMRANRVDRDRAMMDDLFTVYFDTYMDQQWGYDFDVNAYGVQGDGIIRAGGAGGPIPRADRTWNGLFRTAGQIVEDGYTAEMAIPFKSLRYPSRPAGEPHRWGFQIIREVKSKSEENIVWAPMSRSESSFFAQMGVLEGMTNLSRSRNIEILPTFTAIQFGELDAPQGAFVNDATNPDAGVNVKYGITSNLTADFTINPDFSQIESDRTEIEVNQRFPIQYPELRPFFIEGAEIFQIPSPVTLVHTRTIVDPDYGAKLSGKIGSVSVGMLAANDRAPGRLDDPAQAGFGESAHTMIGRARYDLFTESNIGGTITNRQFLDSHSRLAGLDGIFRFSPTLMWDFRLFGSDHRDLAGADRSGHTFATRLQHNGRNLGAAVAGYRVSPDFRTDVGFVRRVDQQVVQSSLNYRFWPESWIINWGPNVSFERNWDFEEVLQDQRVSAGLDFNFARSVSFGANVNRELERFRGTEFEKTRFSIRGNVNTSRRWSFGAHFNTGDQVRYVAQPFLGRGLDWGINSTLRPVSRLESRLSLSSSRLEDPRTGDEVFEIKIARAYTTFQFSDRLSARNITEYNTWDKKLAFNLLFNYRVNAGTVFYLGYDDHYQHADLIQDMLVGDPRDDHLFLPDELWRTRRAIFLKMQYLLRW